jgi:hypothetical protein
MIFLKKLSVTIVLSTALLSICSTATANLELPQINQIVESFGSSNFDDFSDFLEQLGSSSSIDASVAEVSHRYTGGETLDSEQSSTLYRLLGIYTLLKYGKQAIETLKQLVAIPTFQTEGVEQYENPSFLQFAEVLEDIAGN